MGIFGMITSAEYRTAILIQTEKESSMKKLLLFILCFALTTSAVSCENNQPGVDDPTDPPTDDPTQNDPTQNDPTTDTSIPGSKEFDENNIVLSFGAISDIHITAGSDDTESKLRKALAQLKKAAKEHDADGLDAIAIAGDITNSGTKVQMDKFAEIIKGSGIKNVMFTTGNHDPLTSGVQSFISSMGEDYLNADIDKTMLDKGARHCKVNGKHFFFVSPTKYGENCPYDKSVLSWLDASLKKVTEAEPDAYVFVFTHPMLYDTCYGSDLEGDSWYTTHLTDTISKYPQVVTFSGHLHFPINDERSIMQTEFTSVGCGSVCYLAIERGYSNMQSPTVPKDAFSVSSGLLVQVDSNGNMRITRMNFATNGRFKTAWELSYPTADGSHLSRYTAERASVNQAPTLVGTPELTAKVTSGSASNVILTVPAGSDDDLVHHYIVTVKNEESDELGTYKFLSDFYRISKVNFMAKSLTFPLDGITSAGKYIIEVRAVDSWGAQSNAITCEATLGESE